MWSDVIVGSPWFIDNHVDRLTFPGSLDDVTCEKDPLIGSGHVQGTNINGRTFFVVGRTRRTIFVQDGWELLRRGRIKSRNCFLVFSFDTLEEWRWRTVIMGKSIELSWFRCYLEFDDLRTSEEREINSYFRNCSPSYAQGPFRFYPLEITVPPLVWDRSPSLDSKQTCAAAESALPWRFSFNLCTRGDCIIITSEEGRGSCGPASQRSKWLWPTCFPSWSTPCGIEMVQWTSSANKFR